jgi:hypothetical protein
MPPTDARPARTGWRLAAVVLAVALVAAVSATLTSRAFAAGGDPFSDVGADHPFADEIAFVSTRGIAQGFADGTYRPGEPVSRQAMAAFLERSSTYRLVTETVPSPGPSSAFRATVSCERPGDVAVSGGARFGSSFFAYVTESRPTASGGWFVEMRTLTGQQLDASLTMYALCTPGQVVAPPVGTP